jgi:hypothetical protein
MVYFMENPMKIHDLGIPLFMEPPHLSSMEDVDSGTCDLDECPRPIDSSP